MDTKKYLVASLAAFVVYSVLGYIIHRVILGAAYEPLAGSVLRSLEEFSQRVVILYLSNLVFALALVLVYVKGYERGKSWPGQGLRFGLILGTLMAPVALTAYVFLPVPGSVAAQWVLFGYVQMVIAGVVVARLYQPRS